MATRSRVVFFGIVRSLFGIAQMTGAIVSVVLLLRIGITRQSVLALSITAALTLASLLLFRVLKVQETAHEI